MKKRMVILALLMVACSVTLFRCGRSSRGSIDGTVNVSKF
jgi:hypothetical protein